MPPIPIHLEAITAVVRQKVAEVADEPEYGWRGNTPLFMTDDEGHPVVRVAAVNFSPTLDIWQGLRNPAQVGRFHEDLLVFDFGTCSSDRTKKAQMYDDYVCGRCEAICAARGIRKGALEIARINGVEVA